MFDAKPAQFVVAKSAPEPEQDQRLVPPAAQLAGAIIATPRVIDSAIKRANDAL